MSETLPKLAQKLPKPKLSNEIQYPKISTIEDKLT